VTDRDTSAVMKEYDAGFVPNLVGLSGSSSETTRVEKEFEVNALSHPTTDGDDDPDAIANRISAIMASSAR
jgi:cytochrome oxidase Cu insertion factor (SCO1/SenC/PrrC family)